MERSAADARFDLVRQELEQRGNIARSMAQHKGFAWSEQQRPGGEETDNSSAAHVRSVQEAFARESLIRDNARLEVDMRVHREMNSAQQLNQLEQARRRELLGLAAQRNTPPPPLMSSLRASVTDADFLDSETAGLNLAQAQQEMEANVRREVLAGGLRLEQLEAEMRQEGLGPVMAGAPAGAGPW